MTKVKTTVEPHALTRRDRPTLRWSVEEVAPKRGVARTDLVARAIYAPAGLSELERIVRAHELMHARITPAESIDAWVKRGIASWDSLQAIEEIRVNYAIQKAGFDLTHLTDGYEDADGEMAVIQDDWRAAVRFAVSSAGTAGGKRFLVGVRRQSKAWATALQKIQKHFWKQIEGADTGKLGRRRVRIESIFSTEVHETIGLAPAGFAWTEKWAEYLDRLGAMPPPSKTGHVSKKATGDAGAKDNKESETGESKDESGEDNTASQDISDSGETFEEGMRNLKPLNYRDGGSESKWGELIWGNITLTAVSKGSLGKKRTAMNYGRNPRRIARLYTDPQRRVFDHERRSKGGIVLIDGSGSMSLHRDDVISILKVAPGATIAIYSDMDEGRGRPNIHILAKNGKCAEAKNMPDFGAGNGVDLPALEWAISQRKGKEPIVWITDGGVCTQTGNHSQPIVLQCIKTAKANKVICVDHIVPAIKALKQLNNGQAVRADYPMYFKQIVKHLGGINQEQVVTR